jgi:hypothetical protein
MNFIFMEGRLNRSAEFIRMACYFHPLKIKKFFLKNYLRTSLAAVASGRNPCLPAGRGRARPWFPLHH